MKLYLAAGAILLSALIGLLVQHHQIKALRAENETISTQLAEAVESATGWEGVANALRQEADTRRAQDAAMKAQNEAAIARALEAEAELSRKTGEFRRRLAKAEKAPACEALMSADVTEVCGL